jgi:type I restriction enzyme S subunit
MSEVRMQRLKTIARFNYGDSLPDRVRDGGRIPVMGSNGQVGTHRVANTVGATLVIGRKGSFGKVRYVAESAFVIDTAYYIDQRSSHENLRWLSYVLSVAGLDTVSRDTGIPGLSREAAHNVLIPVVQPMEQELMVRYLDHAEMRIAKAIAGKNEVLVKLREAKTAVISELVLGESSDRVETGVPGIGAAPRHWRQRRAKYVWRAVDLRSTTGSEERLTVSSARGIVHRSSATVTMFEAASYIGHKLVEPGNLVINSLWSWATGLGVSKHRGIVSPVYGVYELIDHECDVAYLDHLLRSNVCQWQFQVRSKGIWKSRLSLTDEAFLDMLLVLPPLEEQQAIASKINERTAAIETAMAAIENEIALLKEYRVRLISDVVTGKLDVRAEAANLPDVDPLELAAVLAGGTASTDEEEGTDGDD